MLERWIHTFLSIPGPWAVGAVFFLAAAETALFIGFLLPGEVAVVLGGVLASREHVPLGGVIAAGVAGPILGDSIGYFLGRRYGENVSHKRLKKRWAKAQAWIKRRGAPAVFLGRFVAFLRTFVPPAAGVARMPYRRFLPWSAAAGVIWGTGSALLGYVAGSNFERVIHAMGRAGLLLFGVAVLAGIGTYVFFKLRRRRRS
ncbi:MAG TPA: DedA family protein [Thermoanaerobaculia bacterium]|nr:DedA family protein [Thermoanaerobaculia bacterium]